MSSQLLDALTGDWKTTRAIAQETGLPEAHVKRVLVGLSARGGLVQRKSGSYEFKRRGAPPTKPEYKRRELTTSVDESSKDDVKLAYGELAKDIGEVLRYVHRAEWGRAERRQRLVHDSLGQLLAMTLNCKALRDL